MNTTLFLACTLAALAVPARAQQPRAPFIEQNAIDAAELDKVRGGFSYGDNLLVTLGIDRVVRINGNIVEQSSLQFGDVGKLANGQAQLASDALQGTHLIQNGAHNQAADSLTSSGLGGTLIQNTLNDQLISNQTTIRASVNNAGVVQALNFNGTLNNALNNAVSSK